jgi:hypothetical protein
MGPCASPSFALKIDTRAPAKLDACITKQASMCTSGWWGAGEAEAARHCRGLAGMPVGSRSPQWDAMHSTKCPPGTQRPSQHASRVT